MLERFPGRHNLEQFLSHQSAYGGGCDALLHRAQSVRNRADLFDLPRRHAYSSDLPTLAVPFWNEFLRFVSSMGSPNLNPERWICILFVPVRDRESGPRPDSYTYAYCNAFRDRDGHQHGDPNPYGDRY